MQLGLDRFTFHTCGNCFIELASEEQARKAIQEFNDTEFLHQQIYTKPLKKDFIWGRTSDKLPGVKSRAFFEHELDTAEPLKPLMEERRLMLQVQTPGWGKSAIAEQIIHDTFDKYGIQTISGLQPFNSETQTKPRMLCFIDFKTKAGADQAVQEVHDTEVKGRKVALLHSVLAPWRAHRIGKVAPDLLVALQEKGIAPKETYEDNFMNSDQRRGEKYYNTTRIQRALKKRAEQSSGNRVE